MDENIEGTILGIFSKLARLEELDKEAAQYQDFIEKEIEKENNESKVFLSKKDDAARSEFIKFTETRLMKSSLRTQKMVSLMLQQIMILKKLKVDIDEVPEDETGFLPEDFFADLSEKMERQIASLEKDVIEFQANAQHGSQVHTMMLGFLSTINSKAENETEEE